ncbi:MAG: hypothetical protein CVV33_00430 [Methanomicrobiales archaeon HGW-Methanomicrobiales-4]|nr:MAG: hypothetical protein CVV33_00430 [Methanomicrobiales archaeon HGW-Methanomicrobiales-4]
MSFIGPETQAGLLIITFIMMILVYLKFSMSGIPRLRVIFLCIFCLVTWILSFGSSLIDKSPAHSLLWELLSFLGMAATIFILFIAFYEILASPGM